MHERININQVEKETGVSKRNIRFYESEGLLQPTRNRENGYRVYNQDDIRKIKIIKMLRMLDMPLEEIKKVLCQEQSLGTAVANQQTVLRRKDRELQAAISFCDHLKETELDTLDVDGCLQDIAQAGQGNFFTKWVEDYRCVLQANKDMDFTFIPKTAITNPREFTQALCDYASKEQIDLVITKESMYPEFLIDGVAYTAERNYSVVSRVPVAVVSCRRVDRTVYGDGVEESRKRRQWLLHRWGGVLLAVLFYSVIIAPSLLQDGVTWDDLLIFVALLVLVVTMAYRGLALHYNDKSQ